MASFLGSGPELKDTRTQAPSHGWVTVSNSERRLQLNLQPFGSKMTPFHQVLDDHLLCCAFMYNGVFQPLVVTPCGVI